MVKEPKEKTFKLAKSISRHLRHTGLEVSRATPDR